MARSGGSKASAPSSSPSVAVNYANARHKARKSKAGYTSDGVEDNDVFLLPVSDYQVMAALTILGAAVRLFRIYQPTSVVFDEVHFGGFASKYIKGRFFMDVHPPLAKLIITLFGWLAGFNGDFDFKEIGKDYLEPNVPYVAMRMFPALCGIFLVPTMFLTLKAAGCRTFTAILGAGFIIFENGLLTQARLILLDSPLMIGTAFTVLAFTSFTNQQELGPAHAFQPSWWFWLAMTGLGLGITCSIKWVGLFTIAWVGGLTLVQLWVLLGDTKNVTPRIWAKHFMARAYCLIIIPFTFYLAMFGIHFLCLVNPGDGDGFMSSEFQSTLNSKGMQDTPADVLVGSRATIRHLSTQGGYLHSHPLMYPTGSLQQQITLYPHKDDNNIWLLENQTQPLDANGEPINGTYAWDKLPDPMYIKDGMVLRLYHLPTHRRLHSHDVRPPITEADWQNEVSAYGYEGFDGDANDFFRVEIVKKQSYGSIAQERVRTIDTKFRLVHVMTGCVLFSHKVKLPEWASEQQEVTCARGGSLPNSLWYIESNEHPMLGEGAEKVNYRNPGFFGKFLELQMVMWKTNAGLVESHAWDSRPEAWPVLRRGINFWGRNHRQIYLIGNFFVWWTATAAIVIYLLFKGIAVLRWQRSCSDYANPTFKRFDYEIGMSVLGWAFHYFPFYLMQRQLFLHHYFPALYFSVLAFCQIFDFVTARVPVLGLRERAVFNKSAAVLLLLSAMAVFGLYAPLAYGNTWTKAECMRVKLFNSWDFDCGTFLDNYAAYDEFTSSALAAAQTSAVPSSSAPPAPPPPLPAAGEAQQKPLGDAEHVPGDAHISGAPSLESLPAGHRFLSREEKVEYRDAQGNILDKKQVEALQGKVEFQTRRETRTRVLDAQGNVIQINEGERHEEPPAAPPHPDVEGAEPETSPKQISEGHEDAAHGLAKESVEGEKEREAKAAKPASESNEATKD